MERYHPTPITEPSVPPPMLEPNLIPPELAVFSPFTKKQRDAIIQRDDHHSQMRHYDEDKGWFTNDVCPFDDDPCSSLQVHHIKPQRLGGDDDPRNAITLNECEHNGHCKDGRIQNGKKRQ